MARRVSTRKLPTSAQESAAKLAPISAGRSSAGRRSRRVSASAGWRRPSAQIASPRAAQKNSAEGEQRCARQSWPVGASGATAEIAAPRKALSTPDGAPSHHQDRQPVAQKRAAGGMTRSAASEQSPTTRNPITTVASDSAATTASSQVAADNPEAARKGRVEGDGRRLLEDEGGARRGRRRRRGHHVGFSSPASQAVESRRCRRRARPGRRRRLSTHDRTGSARPSPKVEASTAAVAVSSGTRRPRQRLDRDQGEHGRQSRRPPSAPCASGRAGRRPLRR